MTIHVTIPTTRAPRFKVGDRVRVARSAKYDLAGFDYDELHTVEAIQTRPDGVYRYTLGLWGTRFAEELLTLAFERGASETVTTETTAGSRAPETETTPLTTAQAEGPLRPAPLAPEVEAALACLTEAVLAMRRAEVVVDAARRALRSMPRDDMPSLVAAPGVRVYEFERDLTGTVINRHGNSILIEVDVSLDQIFSKPEKLAEVGALDNLRIRQPRPIS